MTDEDDAADLLEKCRRLGRQKVMCRADQITTLVQIGQAALRDQAAQIERLAAERNAAWREGADAMRERVISRLGELSTKAPNEADRSLCETLAFSIAALPLPERKP